MGKRSGAVLRVRAGFANAFILRGERAVVVDTGPRGCGEAILRALEIAGYGPGAVGLILLTHGHFDHYGGAAALRGALGAPVAVHEADADYVRKGTNGELVPTGRLGDLLLRWMGDFSNLPCCEGLEPDVVFGSEFDLGRHGVRGRVLLTPGHTPGSVSVLLEGGEAVVGDLVMGGVLRSRRPRYPIFAEDIDVLEGSLADLLGYNPTTVHAGHGGPFRPARLRKLARSI